MLVIPMLTPALVVVALGILLALSWSRNIPLSLSLLFGATFSLITSYAPVDAPTTALFDGLSKVCLLMALYLSMTCSTPLLPEDCPDE